MVRADLPVIQASLDLSKELIPRVAKFPRTYKYVLGDRIVGHVLDIQDLLINAVYARKKTGFLDQVNTRLEQLRFLLRLANELGGLAHKGYGHVSKMVDELGRQVGGWRRQSLERRACPND